MSAERISAFKDLVAQAVAAEFAPETIVLITKIYETIEALTESKDFDRLGFTLGFSLATQTSVNERGTIEKHGPKLSVVSGNPKMVDMLVKRIIIDSAVAKATNGNDLTSFDNSPTD